MPSVVFLGSYIGLAEVSDGSSNIELQNGIFGRSILICTTVIVSSMDVAPEANFLRLEHEAICIRNKSFFFLNIIEALWPYIQWLTSR